MNKKQFKFSRRARGVAIVYVAIAMTVFCGIVSLAVDLGRVQLAKAELGAAADAAARAAAASLMSGATDAQVRQEAAEWAARNTVDGTTAVLLNTDVEIGTWDLDTNPKFTSGGLRTAVRVTARRSASRDNAIPLLFGQVIGRSTCDVSASAIATFQKTGFAVIGLEYIKMNGNTTDSYSSSNPGGRRSRGSIVSNGSITLQGSSYVNGDARPGIGQTVYGADGRVAGSTAPLTETLVYPEADPGDAATNNSNAMVPPTNMNGPNFVATGQNKHATLPGGIYYFNNFSCSSSSVITFTGPTTIYCYGTFNMPGTIFTAGNLPANLTISMISRNGNPPGALNIDSGSNVYAMIYSPTSSLNFGGTGDLYGSVVGKSIDMKGTSAIHYDEDLLTARGGVVLVE